MINQKAYYTYLSEKKIIWVVLFFLAIVLKLIFLKNESADYYYFLNPWMKFINSNGFFDSLKYDFYNYTPSYIYILIVIAKLGLNPLYSIKIVSILFEYILAFYIGKIAFLHSKNKSDIWIALAIIPLVPSVLLNSVYWSQCDSIYTTFIVGSIYYILKQKPFLSMVFLGIAFAFKLQSIFILPFFFVFFLRGYIKWYSFFIIPLVYFVSIIPTWMYGRTLTDLFSIYFTQSGYYKELTLNFPNIYIWIDNIYYEKVKLIGIIFTGLITLITGFWLKKSQYIITFESYIKLAFLSAIIIPYIMPGMHERYMYLGDVLGVLYFLVNQKNIHFAVGIAGVSFYSYIRCSRFNEILPMSPAFVIYTLIIILASIDFVNSIKKSSNEIDK